MVMVNLEGSGPTPPGHKRTYAETAKGFYPPKPIADATSSGPTPRYVQKSSSEAQFAERQLAIQGKFYELVGWSNKNGKLSETWTRECSFAKYMPKSVEEFEEEEELKAASEEEQTISSEELRGIPDAAELKDPKSSSSGIRWKVVAAVIVALVVVAFVARFGHCIPMSRAGANAFVAVTTTALGLFGLSCGSSWLVSQVGRDCMLENN